MTTLIGQWDSKAETYREFLDRKAEAETEARLRRQERELFRLALSSLKLDRYGFGVEHGMTTEQGPWTVHAYVVCVECYKDFPGLVDPRTLVCGPDFDLEPHNEVLAVGVNMLDVIRSMMDHEQKNHGGRPR